MVKISIVFTTNIIGRMIIKISVRMILFHSNWFNTFICINNTTFIWYITSDRRYFTRFNFFTLTQERSAVPITRTFDVNLYATKPRTFVHVSEYFLCHKLLLLLFASLLVQMISLPSEGPLFCSQLLGIRVIYLP